MVEISILIDADIDTEGKPIVISTITQKMLSALLEAIASHPSPSINYPSNEKIQPIAPASVIVRSVLNLEEYLNSNHNYSSENQDNKNIIFCPLTLNIPSNLPFPGQQVYQICRDVIQLRQQVAAMGYATGNGLLWLPIVLTAKGALYGEAIGVSSPSFSPNSDDITYYQPVHLSDYQRQDLYKLAYKLLKSISAPPATYLMQFSATPNICFDKLWPFPAPPALASLPVQKPDLFTCHWYCLRHWPILDLQILKK